jgi:hypothetical protein
MEAKDPKSAESSGAQNTETKDPKSDATSSETLSEIEKTEKVSETDDGGADEKGHSPSPSPDGAFDEGRTSTNGINDAGPM